MPDFAICDHMTSVIGPNAGCNLLFYTVGVYMRH